MNCTTCNEPLSAHETGLYVCPRCTRRATGWLRELPAQLTVLRGSSARETTSGPTGGRTGTRTAPLPGRLDVLNLLGPGSLHIRADAPDQIGEPSITATLTRATNLVRNSRALRGPASADPEAHAAWLAPHLPWTAEQRWATDLHTRLRQMMRDIRAVTRVRPLRRPLPQPCPSCDALGLWEEDWQEYRWCTCCGVWLTAEDLALGAAGTLARREAETAA